MRTKLFLKTARHMVLKSGHGVLSGVELSANLTW